MTNFYERFLFVDPQPDVLLLQEIWSLPQSTVEQFAGWGYTLVASHLRQTRCGGVCIFVRSITTRAAPIPCNLPASPAIDVCAAWVGPLDGREAECIGIATVYIQPVKSMVVPDTDTWLDSCIATIGSTGVELIAGDFNARHSNWCPTWEKCQSDRPSETSPLNRGARLVGITRSTSWKIANKKEATRYPPGDHQGEGSAPDVVLHRGHLACTFSVCQPVQQGELAADVAVASDHCPIRLLVGDLFDMPVHFSTRCPNIAWGAVRDWEAVRRQVCARLRRTRTLQPEDPAFAYYHQLAKVVTETLRSLPQSSRTQHKVRNPLPEELRTARETANAAIRADKPETYLEAIRTYRELIRAHMETATQRRWDSLAATPTRNAAWARRLWRLFSHHTRPQLPTLTTPEGKPLSAHSQADILARTFAAKYVLSSHPEAIAYANELQVEVAALRATPHPIPPAAAEITVYLHEVEAAIAGIQKDQAGDTWGMKPIFLCNMPQKFLQFLARTFTASLRDGVVPREWLRSDVIPLFKGAPKDPKCAESYRPVAITNLLCRVLESVVVTRIRHHMRADVSYGFHPHQFGFQRGVSTEMAAGHLLNDMLTASSYYMKWHSRGAANIAYARMTIAVDFTDAFCRVTPDKVEWAMRRRRIPHYLCAWVRAYLTGRTQRVFVGGRFSAPFDTPIGCPQGSILGPFLWNLAMDDLLNIMDAFCTEAAAITFTKPPKHPPPPSTGKRGQNNTQTIPQRVEPPSRNRRQTNKAERPANPPTKQPRRKPNTDSTGSQTLRPPVPLCDELAAAARDVSFAPDKDGRQLTPPWPQLDLPKKKVAGPLCSFAAYADDLTIWVAAHSPRLAAGTVQCMLNRIATWARKNGVQLSTKTDGRWLTSASRIPDVYPMHPISLRIGEGVTITIPGLAVGHRATLLPLRILGLWIDEGLTFRAHVEHVKRKVDTILNETRHHLTFMAPSLRYQVVRALVAPLILQFTPIFWDAASPEVRSVLERAWTAMCTTITCAMRIARSPAVILEAGLRPLPFHVRRAGLQLQRRLWMLPPEYEFLWAPPPGLRATVRPGRRDGDGHLLTPSEGRVKDCWRSHLLPIPAERQRRFLPAYHLTPVGALARTADKTRFLTSLVLDGAPLPKKDPAHVALYRRFNTSQLQTSAAAGLEVWTDGSVEPLQSSGGAFVVVFNDNIVDEGKTSLGDAACSYSMERASLLAGVQALRRYQQQHTFSSSPRVRIVTDSLSTLQELRRGPFCQQEEQMEAVWQELAALDAETIFVVFVFSHTESEDAPPGYSASAIRYNTCVDHLAEAALSPLATGPQWPQDLIRPRIQALAAEADEAPEVKCTLRYRTFGTGSPSTDIRLLRFRRTHQRLLLQLRTGVCHKLGGWTDNSRCRHCHCPITRISQATEAQPHAVYHLFHCPRFPTNLEVRALWLHPEEAIAHALAFLAPPP